MTVTGQHSQVKIFYRDAEASDRVTEPVSDPDVYEGRSGFPESMQRIFPETSGKRSL